MDINFTTVVQKQIWTINFYQNAFKNETYSFILVYPDILTDSVRTLYPSP